VQALIPSTANEPELIRFNDFDPVLMSPQSCLAFPFVNIPSYIRNYEYMIVFNRQKREMMIQQSATYF
jgi:hypothetical protein